MNQSITHHNYELNLNRNCTETILGTFLTGFQQMPAENGVKVENIEI
jgi:hypothetical protein